MERLLQKGCPSFSQRKIWYRGVLFFRPKGASVFQPDPAKRQIPPKYENYIHAAGFALLMLLMLAVTFQDVFRIIGG